MTTHSRFDAITARTIVVLSAVLFAWTHRYALALPGFAEDIGLVQQLATNARHGTLPEVLWQRVIGPLWGPGSTMWRPLAFASLGLDALMYGDRAGGWHVTNLILHGLTAVFTGLLAQRLLLSKPAAALAFGTALLHPWTAEITLWLVGRFDGWATAGMALGLWAGAMSRGCDRWLLVSALAGTVAYASKESALLLPVGIAMLVVVEARRLHPNVSMFAPPFFTQLLERKCLVIVHVLLATGYLACRGLLLANAGINVYSSAPIHSVVEIASRLGRHAEFFWSLELLAPTASKFVALVAATLTLIVVARGNKWVGAMGLLWAFAVFLGAALHFVTTPGVGDGMRLYYLSALGFALFVAAALSAVTNRVSLALAATWICSLAIWQNEVNRQWWGAADELKLATFAIDKEIKLIAPADYGLLMLPDPMGHVPMVRNAQGAIITEAQKLSPEIDALSKMVMLLPMQIDEWHGLMQQDVVRLITKRSDAPPRPTRFYCKEPGRDHLSHLGFWPSGTLAEWRAQWRKALDEHCPSLVARKN
jgi:hypothetical protein